MLVVLLVWIYIAVLLAASKLPDIPAVLGTLALYGAIPLVLLLLKLRGRASSMLRAQQRARENTSGSPEPRDSVHGGMNKVDEQDARND